MNFFYFFFFFSSRRRHTRLTCDWSSDACSSDLTPGGLPDLGRHTTLFTCVPSGQAIGTGKILESNTPGMLGYPSTDVSGTGVPSKFLLMSPFTATLDPAAVRPTACSSWAATGFEQEAPFPEAWVRAPW